MVCDDVGRAPVGRGAGAGLSNPRIEPEVADELARRLKLDDVADRGGDESTYQGIELVLEPHLLEPVVAVFDRDWLRIALTSETRFSEASLPL